MSAPQFIPFTPLLYREAVEPLQIGSLISFLFFGVGLVQFYLCFSKLRVESSQDKITKYFLIVLFISDLGDQIGKGIFIGDQMRNIVLGGLLGSATLAHSAYALIVSETVITCLNHAVYVYRIWRLTPNRGFFTYAVLALAIGISITHIIGGAFLGHTWIPRPLQTWGGTDLTVTTTLWIGGAAAADVLLCGLLISCLARHRSEFSNTNDIITRWIGLSLETGAFPSAMQVTTLALALAYPSLPYNISIALIQPKVYVNAMLIIVNTVISNRNMGSNVVTAGVGSGSYNPRSAPNEYYGGHGAYPASGVQLKSMNPARSGSNNVASQIVVTSEVFRQPDHVDLVDQADEYEKRAFDQGSGYSTKQSPNHAYSGGYGR